MLLYIDDSLHFNTKGNDQLIERFEDDCKHNSKYNFTVKHIGSFP